MFGFFDNSDSDGDNSDHGQGYIDIKGNGRVTSHYDGEVKWFSVANSHHRDLDGTLSRGYKTPDGVDVDFVAVNGQMFKIGGVIRPIHGNFRDVVIESDGSVKGTTCRVEKVGDYCSPGAVNTLRRMNLWPTETYHTKPSNPSGPKR